MSTLLSTSAMVTECQSRVPIGLSSAFWMKKLNEAFRWINQKGNFVWEQRNSPVTVNVGQAVFALPSDFNPGKPMALAGPFSGVTSDAGNVTSTVPYLPWDSALDQQLAEVVAPTGMFSCWSYNTNFAVGPPAVFSYQAELFPASAKPTSATGAFQFRFVYHADVGSAEYAAASNIYFPTPNCFDNLLIELAEAEARRIYGLAGFEMIQKRAESAIVTLLDSYRSTKNLLAGLTDQQKQNAEKKMMAQERS